MASREGLNRVERQGKDHKGGYVPDTGDAMAAMARLRRKGHDGIGSLL